MVTKEQIDRINELARKHKSVGLTPEEEIERAALRREYINSMVNSLKGHLDNTYFVEADGSISEETPIMFSYDTIDYIYYDISTQKLIYNKTNCTQNHYKQYNTESFKTTEENQDVYILLNQWINTQTTYSHTFTKWKSKTDLPAVFEE